MTLLRFANVLGRDVETSHTPSAALPVVPMILGFDPRYQFVHEDDVVRALAHVTQFDLPGIFNVAADGVLALTEVAGLLGKQYLPVLPPWGTGLALGPLRRLGVPVPPEMLGQLRFGRGLDNRKLKATGLRLPLHDARDRPGVRRVPAAQPILRGMREPYRYEREVEDFLRWSPHVTQPELPQGEPDVGGRAGRAAEAAHDLRRPVGGDRRGAGGARAAQAEAGRPRRARACATHEAIDAARARNPSAAGEASDAGADASKERRAAAPRRALRRPRGRRDRRAARLLEDGDLQALRDYESGSRRPAARAGRDRRGVARRAGGPSLSSREAPSQPRDDRQDRRGIRPGAKT